MPQFRIGEAFWVPWGVRSVSGPSEGERVQLSERRFWESSKHILYIVYGLK